MPQCILRRTQAERPRPQLLVAKKRGLHTLSIIQLARISDVPFTLPLSAKCHHSEPHGVTPLEARCNEISMKFLRSRRKGSTGSSSLFVPAFRAETEKRNRYFLSQETVSCRASSAVTWSSRSHSMGLRVLTPGPLSVINGAATSSAATGCITQVVRPCTRAA